MVEENRKQSLNQVKVIHQFLTGVTIFILCFGYATFYAYEQKLEYMVFLDEVRDEMVVELSSVLNVTDLSMKYIGDEIAEDKAITKQKIYQIFNRLTRIDTFEREFFTKALLDFATPQGVITVNSGIGILEEPLDIKDRSYYLPSRKYTGRLIIEKPVVGKISGDLIIPLALGISDRRGDFVGTIITALNFETLERKLVKITHDEDVNYLIVHATSGLLISSDEKLPQLDLKKEGLNLSNLKHEEEIAKNPYFINENYYHSLKKLENFDVYVIAGYKDDRIENIYFQSYKIAGVAFFILSLLFMTSIRFLQENMFEVISNITSIDLRKKLNLVKYSDKAKEILAYNLQKSLQSSLLGEKGFVNFANANIKDIVAESILISSKEALSGSLHLVQIDNVEHGDIVCDELRIKQIVISIVRQLMELSSEQAVISIEIESIKKMDQEMYQINFYSTHLDLQNMDVMLDQKRSDDVINNFVYLDPKQIEYYVKLHRGEVSFGSGKEKKMHFHLLLPRVRSDDNNEDTNSEMKHKRAHVKKGAKTEDKIIPFPKK